MVERMSVKPTSLHDAEYKLFSFWLVIKAIMENGLVRRLTRTVSMAMPGRSRLKLATVSIVCFVLLVSVARLYQQVPACLPPRALWLLQRSYRRNLPGSVGLHANSNSFPNGTCLKKKRIALVKVHKAASTTVTSIIQRFGLFHNMVFALPKDDYYHIGLFETIDPKKILPIPQGSVYEILCQHVVYNRAAFQKYLPSDIIVIASVREPLQQFVSSFLYFDDYSAKVKTKAKVTGDVVTVMRTFLQDPVSYELYSVKAGHSLVMSRMSFDLGVPVDQFHNASYVQEYLKLLDDDIALVLVAEYFDESLVILKHMLCWTMKDIVYEARHKSVSKKLEIPEDIKSLHRKLAPSEYQIYEHFRKKMLHRLEEQGEDFYEEVEVFRATLAQVSEYCRKFKSGISPMHSIDNEVSTILYIEGFRFEEGFTFYQEDCRYLQLEEEQFVKHLIKLQTHMLNK